MAIKDTEASKAMEMHVCRIWPLTTPDTVHYLKIGWDEDLGNGFTITLCNGEQAWSGSVSSDQITIEANEAEMDREKYVEDLRCALLTRDEKTNRYSFDFIKDSEREVFHFSYEKVSQDISFKLGSVELKEVSSTTEVIKELIDIVLQSNTELRSRNNSLQQENKRLLSERNSGLERLEEYVKAKEDLEQDLYSRFILVLNAKKAKIRQLLEHLKCVREQTEDGIQCRTAAATGQETLLTEECNTDEDHSSHTSTSRSLAQPSTSVTGFNRHRIMEPTTGSSSSVRPQHSDHPQRRLPWLYLHFRESSSLYHPRDQKSTILFRLQIAAILVQKYIYKSVSKVQSLIYYQSIQL
ncbi:DNA repair protein XRCC4 isoform X3 [Hypanus sabinus]|uniref:DNA repair protein XRCC4 isoform X3 n=1 Tax=Hypanus sabinus TaxID=79690 RepID=UPI0028C3A1F9|nr:DNA repair protein XRCC4 isoform X3 [Hypanus sabinus]